MRALAALILLACVIAALAAANRSKPLLVDADVHRAGIPVDHNSAATIPWLLNTPCHVDHRTLVQRDPERKA
jgi:hypothetical protein